MASVKPDMVTIDLTLRKSNKSHEKAMTQADELLEELKKTVEAAGFDKDALKTASFNVEAEYESECDERGIYREKFKGYACIHRLKLEFDFDKEMLSKALSAVAQCVAEPEIYVRFTVKNKDSVDEKLLENAARNAHEKARILAAASGVKLGKLVSIEYGQKDDSVFSQTELVAPNKCMRAMGKAMADINPENIEMSDSAVFTWEIE